MFDFRTHIHRVCKLDILFTENNAQDGSVYCDNGNSFAVLTGIIEKLKEAVFALPQTPRSFETASEN